MRWNRRENTKFEIKALDINLLYKNIDTSLIFQNFKVDLDKKENSNIDNMKENENPILLPRFSCHNLRHTFTTRLVEAGVNVKVIQSLLGHSDISITLDIYADVTRELKKAEMENFEDFLKKRDAM